MESEELEKVYVELPNHWASKTEMLWAKPIGDGLYVLMNTPLFAYGLNYLDTIKVKEDKQGRLLVKELVEHSGHSTLRVVFKEGRPEEEQDAILNRLAPLGLTYERADERFVAVDVTPDGKPEEIFHHLDKLAVQEVLDFETCEAKKEGSFDDVASEM